jgi:hypothetical protein
VAGMQGETAVGLCPSTLPVLPGSLPPKSARNIATKMEASRYDVYNHEKHEKHENKVSFRVFCVFRGFL